MRLEYLKRSNPNKETNFGNFPLKTKLLSSDFDTIRQVYIDSQKGSDEQDIALHCLIEKMLTFRQFKIVYHYVSADKNLQSVLKKEMLRRAISFDDWYFLYMISTDRDNEELCLFKMLSRAKDFYELRCVYANSKQFSTILLLSRLMICSLPFSDNHSWEMAIDACNQFLELKEALLIKRHDWACPRLTPCKQS